MDDKTLRKILKTVYVSEKRYNIEKKELSLFIKRVRKWVRKPRSVNELLLKNTLVGLKNTFQKDYLEQTFEMRLNDEEIEIILDMDGDLNNLEFVRNLKEKERTCRH